MPTNNNNNSPHILNASSNLVGFSFLVLTTVKVLGLPNITVIDQIAAAEIFLFCVSSLLSFVSMRTSSERRSNFYEYIADYIFFIGLIILSLTAALISFAIIK